MKILITLKKDCVAPRFDLTTEVLIAEGGKNISMKAPRNVLMPGPSGDELCSLILKENIDVVICGGIEESFFQYLQWKKVKVIDRIIGPADTALKMSLEHKLRPGMIINNNPHTGENINEIKMDM